MARWLAKSTRVMRHEATVLIFMLLTDLACGANEFNQVYVKQKG